MRQLISILLVISLSWVTTGYACQMDQRKVVRAVCCCKTQHGAMAMADAEHPQADAVANKPCCERVFSAAVDEQQPGIAAAAPTLDLPVFLVLPTVEWSLPAPTADFSRLSPPVRGPPGAGTRTYLATSRLRL